MKNTEDHTKALQAAYRRGWTVMAREALMARPECFCADHDACGCMATWTAALTTLKARRKERTS